MEQNRISVCNHRSSPIRKQYVTRTVPATGWPGGRFLQFDLPDGDGAGMDRRALSESSSSESTTIVDGAYLPASVQNGHFEHSKAGNLGG